MNTTSRRTFPWILAGIYLGVSAVWIIASDSVLHAMVGNAAEVQHWQTAKGLFFIAGTTAMLFAIVRRYDESLEARSRELRGSREQFRSLFDTAMDAIITIDENQNVVMANEAAREMFRCGDEDLAGKSIDLLIPTAARERHRAMVTEFGESGRTDRSLRHKPVLTGRRLDGTEFPMEASISRYTVEGNIYFTAIVRDVADRVIRDEERRRLLERTELLMDSTSDGFVLVDEDGRLLLLNRSGEAMLGSAAEELIGTNIRDAVRSVESQDDHDKALSVVFAGIPIEHRKLELTRRDGTTLPIELSATPLKQDGEMRGAAVSMRDLTLVHQLESRLEEVRRVESLGKLTAVVSHEMKNILMSIQAFLDVIRRVDGMGEKVHTAISGISRAIERGRTITSEVLRFSKAQSPDPEVIDAARFLSTIEPGLRSLLTPKVELVMDIATERVGRFSADTGQLEQVFVNLVANARDAMPQGGRLKITADVPRTEIPGLGGRHGIERYIHFAVSDTGIGMSAEVRDHALEPMFTTKRAGTGLGLAVAQRIVSSHGGSLLIDSRLGIGTTIHILLPREVEPNRGAWMQQGPDLESSAPC
ncbi:MAG: PAS domain S-box protein [Thermoanaerobaculia bacterium]